MERACHEASQGLGSTRQRYDATLARPSCKAGIEVTFTLPGSVSVTLSVRTRMAWPATNSGGCSLMQRGVSYLFGHRIHPGLRHPPAVPADRRIDIHVLGITEVVTGGRAEHNDRPRADAGGEMDKTAFVVDMQRRTGEQGDDLIERRLVE